MQLEAARPRAGFHADVRRIERGHRPLARVESIAVHAIQPQLCDEREAAVFAEYDAVRARTWLARAEWGPGVLIRVEAFGQLAIRLDAVGRYRAAVVCHRDRNFTARVQN